MPFMTVAWRSAYSIGALPEDPGYVTESPLTIGWTGKLSTYVLPYDLADLTVRPGDPDPPVVNPPDGGGGGGTPQPPSGEIRPATPPRLQIQPRVNPVRFRSRGIRVRITLPEAAQVELYAQSRVRKTLSRKRTRIVTRKITRHRKVRLPQGVSALFVSPSSAGRAAVGRRTRLKTTMVVTTRYADGRTVTVRQSVLIAPKPGSHR
ncbi:hypothetical protein PAI11_18410 [Patulibacter medicamentivorans]|jgi:hypothetical protein|uniref:Uncharacterized protein n=1 Tax=Patulibacter medicamentivorans TaxID=1097667 RepID=H0E4W0_9ACTN|nr:hypothetical protein [Patulibacter medicamentivorans]EHN11287.1 hypothetical protein PAI11_18410 [Patulibacter medicamentivorans]